VKLIAIAPYHAAVAVGGVFAQADIRDQHQLLRGCRLLQRTQALLRDARSIVGAATLFVLRLRQAKQQQATQS